jgi:hypothetical protein
MLRDARMAALTGCAAASCQRVNGRSGPVADHLQCEEHTPDFSTGSTASDDGCKLPQPTYNNNYKDITATFGWLSASPFCSWKRGGSALRPVRTCCELITIWRYVSMSRSVTQPRLPRGPHTHWSRNSKRSPATTPIFSGYMAT